MAEVFTLPKMGQTMHEGTILRWLKQEGDAVEGWEGIVEMMTDKIDMEVEPQISGTILKILAAEGSVVPVGGPIAVIGAPGEDITQLLAGLRGPGGAAEGGAPAPQAAGASDRVAAPRPLESTPGHAAGAAPAEFPSVSPRARETAAGGGLDWKSLSLAGSGFEGMIVERDVLGLLASGAQDAPAARPTPLAARMAAGLGVPLEGLAGTGPRGRVTADDVRRAAGRRAAPAIEAREVPLRGMRRVIAERLSASYREAVHVPIRLDVDMTAAVELRRQLKPALDAAGCRLTFTDLIAAAAVRALVEHPALNATLEGDVLRVHPSVNLGIAVALPEGLTVPVIRNAETMRLPELSGAIQQAAERARSGALGPEAYAGGTFTLTNLGQFGVDSFDPIINPPQVGILGAGGIRDRIVAWQGAPAVRPVMTLTVTFDHRALDGAPAAQFLALVRELLENPARLAWDA